MFGYIRENTLNQRTIPIALIKMFEAYYNNFIHWKIPGINHDLKQGLAVTIDGISMRITFNAVVNAMSPYFFIYIDVDKESLPKNSVGIELKVTIKENTINSTQTKFMHYNEAHLDEYLSYPRMCFDLVGLEKHTQLDAEFTFDIINIKYCTMSTDCSSNWIFNKKNMDEFRAKGQIDSEISNDWKIRFVSSSYDNFARLTMIPIGFPCSDYINVVKIKLILKVISLFGDKDGKEIVFRELQNIKPNDNDYEGKGVTYDYGMNKLEWADQLKIFANIKMISIYDHNMDEIAKEKWSEYGFVINDKK